MWVDVPAEIRPFSWAQEGCFMYKWTTNEFGLIVVTRQDGTQFIPTLTGKWADIMSSVIARWSDTVRPIADQFGVPERWILAMIYQESNGNPRAFRKEPNGWTGVGLLQITHPNLKGGHTDEQLFDPQLNLTIGTRYMREIARRQDVNWDFPRVSATFNAGSPRPNPKSEWNLYCYGNHVDSEVSAHNYYVLRNLRDQEHPDEPRMAALAGPSLSDLSDDLRREDLAERNREEGFSDEPDTSVEGKRPV